MFSGACGAGVRIYFFLVPSLFLRLLRLLRLLLLLLSVLNVSHVISFLDPDMFPMEPTPAPATDMPAVAPTAEEGELSDIFERGGSSIDTSFGLKRVFLVVPRVTESGFCFLPGRFRVCSIDGVSTEERPPSTCNSVGGRCLSLFSSCWGEGPLALRPVCDGSHS